MTYTKKVKVAVFAAFITTINFAEAKGDEKSKHYNRNPRDQEQLVYCYLPVRATKFHKSEPGCDSDTKKGKSSTGVMLQEGGPGVVGTIAADKSIVPIGSLVLVTTKDGNTNPYLCVDSGGAVVSRKASRQLAKQEGRGKEWATRPVIDIYSPRAVTTDWTTVLVIKSRPLDGLKDSERLERLKERMSVEYWMPRGQASLDQRIQAIAYNK